MFFIDLKYPVLYSLLLPLIGSIILGMWGRRFGQRTIASVAISTVFGSFLLSLYIALKFWGTGDPVLLSFGNLIEVTGLEIPLGFHLDGLSVLLLTVVTAVASLILVYSTGYMVVRSSSSRFFGLMTLSVFFMLALILADNFITLLIGWSGIAVTTYLLIGFRFYNSDTVQSAKRFFIINAVSDTALLVGLILLITSPIALNYSGTGAGLTYRAVFENLTTLSVTDKPFLGSLVPLFETIAILIFIGAAGKSAQLLQHIWLPNTSDTPIPAIALMQSVTTVAAGVYLMARLHPVLLFAPTAMAIIAVISALSAFIAAGVALVQTDMKKILAWSTISQVGLMFLGCGVGAVAAAIFHLVTHAVVKSCLILSVGSVKYAMEGETDIRRLGGLKSLLPFTRVAFLAAVAALSGFPMLAGFFSVSEIFHGTFTLPFIFGWKWLAGIVGYAAIPVTAFYAYRLYYRIFEGEYHKPPGVEPSEPDLSMEAPVWISAALSVIGGIIAFPKPEFNVIDRYLSPVIDPPMISAIGFWGRTEDAFSSYFFMPITVGVFLIGYWVARNIYLRRPDDPREFKIHHKDLHMYLWDELRVEEILDVILIRPAKWIVSWLWREVDEGLIDRGIVEGTGKSTFILARMVNLLRNGYTRYYLLYLAIFITLVIWLASRQE